MRAPVAVAAILSLAVGAWSAPAQIVDASPIVRSLGVIDGPPGQIFDRVRSVHPLPGGRLLVADGGSHQLRIYGEGPDPVAVFGAPGQGPGEFVSLTWAAPYRGDSLVAWDADQGRLTVATPDLELGRTVRVGAGGGVSMSSNPRAAAASRLDVVAPAEGGRFVARRGDLMVGPGDTTAVRRDPFTYVLLDPEGRVERELTTLPDDEHFVWSDGPSRSVRPRAFGRVTSVGVGGGTMAWAANEGFRVHRLDLASGRESEVAADRERRPVTDTERSRWLEAHGPSPDLPPRFRENHLRALEAMPFPERMPWHGALVVAEDGELWLEEYRADPGEPAAWTAFGPSGEPRRIRFPAGFRLTAVAGGRAYGVTTGEFDVERVTVIEIPER